MASEKQDYYGESAKLYSSVRPHYSQEIFSLIYDFAGPGTDLALDVATGSGQSAQSLAKRFKQVLAVDISEGQLKQCLPHPKITFRVADAANTGAADSSVDLITAASALHWLDIPAFYREARRVLKPDGTLAAFCYRVPEAVGLSEANRAFRDFPAQLRGSDKLEVHNILGREYRGVEPTADDFEVVQRAETSFVQCTTLGNWIGFFPSTGAYRAWHQKNPDAEDPVPAYKQKVLAAAGTDDETQPVTLRYPVFMVLAKNPKPL